MNDETIPGQLEDLRDSVNQRFQEGHDRMGAIETAQTATNSVLAKMNLKLDSLGTKLDDNTASTKIVEDVLTTARTGKTILVWIAAVGGSVASLWIAARQIWPH